MIGSGHGRRGLAALVAAAVVVGVSLLGAGSATAVGHQVDRLLAGQVLAPGDQLVQRTQTNTFLVMQPDGNLVQYARSHEWTSETPGTFPVFSTGTAGHPGAQAVLQLDGNLVVYSAEGRPLWWSGTAGSGGRELVLQDDSNMVLYSATGPVWQKHFWPPSTLRAPGWFRYMSSPSGRYFLGSGSDGMVLIDKGRYAEAGGLVLWYESGCDPLRTCGQAQLQRDGNLVLYPEGGGPARWSSGTYGPGGVLVVQDDGNVVLYGPEGPRWWTGTSSATTVTVRG